ncbi:uncharacterized protein LOC144579325 isoform X2 [Callithrix jacchus]
MELRPLQHRPWGLGLTVRRPCSGPSRQKRMGAHHREQEGPALPSRQQELPEPAFSDDVTVQACITSQQSAEFHCPHCRPGGSLRRWNCVLHSIDPVGTASLWDNSGQRPQETDEPNLQGNRNQLYEESQKVNEE